MLEVAIAKYFVIFCLAYLSAWMMVPVVKRLAELVGAVDIPDERRVHAAPTPRCGGLAVFTGVHVAAIAIFILFPELDRSLISWDWWRHFFTVSLLIVIVGLIDDIFQIGAVYKLSGQIVAAVLMFFYGIQFQGFLGIHFSPAFNLLATICWFVFLINAFNLIDGYDGLASGIAAIAALGLGGTLVYRHLPLEALLMVGLVAACLGFLRYNVYPASIFLGDSGSMFLGFTLASVALGTVSKGTSLAAIWIPILALGVPVFDTLLAIWRRSARKVLKLLRIEAFLGGVMTADTDHLHHRLMRQGITPRNVTATLYLANSVLVLFGLCALAFHDFSIGILSAGFGLAAYIVIRYAARIEIAESGRIIAHGLKSAVASRSGLSMIAILDGMFMMGSYLLTDWLLALPFPSRGAGVEYGLPLWSWVVLVLIPLFQPYSEKLHRYPTANINFLLLSGLMITVLGITLFNRPDFDSTSVGGFLFIGIVIFSLSFWRILLGGFRSLVVSGADPESGVSSD